MLKRITKNCQRKVLFCNLLQPTQMEDILLNFLNWNCFLREVGWRDSCAILFLFWQLLICPIVFHLNLWKIINIWIHMVFQTWWRQDTGGLCHQKQAILVIHAWIINKPCNFAMDIIINIIVKLQSHFNLTPFWVGRAVFFPPLQWSLWLLFHTLMIYVIHAPDWTDLLI